MPSIDKVEILQALGQLADQAKARGYTNSTMLEDEQYIYHTIKVSGADLRRAYRVYAALASAASFSVETIV